MFCFFYHKKKNLFFWRWFSHGFNLHQTYPVPKESLKQWRASLHWPLWIWIWISMNWEAERAKLQSDSTNPVFLFIHIFFVVGGSPRCGFCGEMELKLEWGHLESRTMDIISVGKWRLVSFVCNLHYIGNGSITTYTLWFWLGCDIGGAKKLGVIFDSPTTWGATKRTPESTKSQGR